MSGEFEGVSALKRMKLIVLALSLVVIASTLYLYDDMQNGLTGVLSDSRVFRMLKKKKNKKKGKSGGGKVTKAKRTKRPTKAPVRDTNFMWLLGFPGSGSKELLRMFEDGWEQPHATTYGDELFYPDDKRYKNGPFRSHSNYMTDDAYDDAYDDDYYKPDKTEARNVLVETYCTGFCIGDSCNHKDYMRNLLGKASKFNSACAKGLTTNKKGKMVHTRAFTKDDNIKDVLILVRNPVTMLGARMADEKGVNAMDLTRDDFVNYCGAMNSKYQKSPDIKKLMKNDPSINDAANGVHCYTEFLRIAIWYKNVFALASGRRKKVVLRWENLISRAGHWVNDASEKLGLTTRRITYDDDDTYYSGRMNFPADNDGSLIRLTTAEEYEKIMKYIKAIVEPSEWQEIFEVYADIHPDAGGPLPTKGFIRFKGFYSSDSSTKEVVDGTTAEKCEVECKEYSWCHSFEFVTTTGRCKLYTDNKSYADLRYDGNTDHYAGMLIHENMHLDPVNVDDDDDDDYGYFSSYADYVNKYEMSYNETLLEKKVEEFQGTVEECQSRCVWKRRSWCKTFDYHKNEGKCTLRGMHTRRSKLTPNSGTKDHYALIYDYDHKYSMLSSGVNRCEDEGKKSITSVHECRNAIDDKTNKRCYGYGGYGGCDDTFVDHTTSADAPYGCSVYQTLNTNIDATGVSSRWDIICKDGPF